MSVPSRYSSISLGTTKAEVYHADIRHRRDWAGHASISAGALEKRLPPGWIVDVPLNSLVEPFLETAARFPIQFALRK